VETKRRGQIMLHLFNLPKSRLTKPFSLFLDNLDLKTSNLINKKKEALFSAIPVRNCPFSHQIKTGEK
jgi:hypothetical protein